MDILDSVADALVNPVNCVGAMGGGLARQFRLRYPEMNTAYEEACRAGEVRVGKMWNWFDEAANQWLVNFPTKDHWRDPSTVEYVVDGLKDLRSIIDDLDLASVAIPALGCGLGGLKWDDVQPLIHSALGDLVDDVEVEIYTPVGDRYFLMRAPVE